MLLKSVFLSLCLFLSVGWQDNAYAMENKSLGFWLGGGSVQEGDFSDQEGVSLDEQNH
jgi:hypothetical protein